MIKSAEEIEHLRRAGRAIDRVHEQVPDFLRPGRTEREVGDDIAEAILAAGHATVDFVIVASGPNGASPHHEVSDRRINVGDPVVVDIGGTMPSGYCSDSTRTYAVGHAPDDFLAYYAVLQPAQRAAVEAVRPGVTAESVDAAARDVITEAGLRRALHPPHRARHRAGDPRRALHRSGQRRAAACRHGVQRRARDLPARPARRPHRGHRRGDR